MNLIREDINDIEAYKPGKPIEEVRRELGLNNIVKLASNENPLGPSPRALTAVKKALRTLNRYPEGSCFNLKRKLAKVLGIHEGNLMFGNGSDELIDVILKVIKAPDADIITSDATFVEYKIGGRVNGFRIITVPLKDFTFDLPAMLERVTPKTKAVFIANPNNPTGTYVTAAAVSDFLARIPENVLVVFDEAYFEFVDEKDFPRTLELFRKGGRRNIAILRTFSKIYGLAGLRVGYMIAAEDFIGAAERVRQPFNVNSLAQAAACAALDDRAFVRKSRQLVRREKRLMYKAFAKLGIWFKKSAANFIFIRTNKDTQELFTELLRQGVIIRDMSSFRLNRYSRVTIGTKKENLKLLNALKNIKRL
ncbi:MAG: histidinol-phosphate transaminase [Candidatus Omnitrophica bacterium]|nr:histidinol-phosphate transaminase [Candidatus Omnitrophota bacterium]MDD5574130.1 histidinol-phosphate transaminase [Candidatus Omnitrophota bacterium]